MEELYQTYKDIAEFRLIYINEAHAADSSWAVGYAKEKGITVADDYAERCTTAEMLLNDKSLTIPFVIDGMDNAVNKAYKAWPDRVFLIRTDGRLAVAAPRGPWGFKPSIEATESFLKDLRAGGTQPALPDSAAEPGEDTHVTAETEEKETSGGETATSKPAGDRGDAAAPGSLSTRFGPALGTWEMATDLQGRLIDAVMTISIEKGKVVGVWESMDRKMAMNDISFVDGVLSFTRSMGGDQNLEFEGAVEGNSIDGTYSGSFGELSCNGKRASG